MSRISEIHCHRALSAGTSKVTIWLIIKAGNSNTCPRKGRWGTGSPRFSALSSQALGIILFEDHSLAHSLIMQHRQGQLANLTASLKCCPKPGTLNALQEKWSGVLVAWQVSLLLNSTSSYTYFMHLINTTLSNLISPSWMASVLSNDDINSPYYRLPGLLKSLTMNCRKLIYGKYVYLGYSMD